MEDKGHELRLPVIITITSIALLFFQALASNTGAFVARLIDYSTIDSYGVFACISVHHIIQMVIALAAIVIIKKKTDMNFFLKPNISKSGIIYTVLTTLIIAAAVFVVYVVLIKSGVQFKYNYPLDAKNITGSLGFQLILSGPSEEILFRALPLTLLLFFWNKEGKTNLLIPVLITALLFSAAHINWSISPLQISFGNCMQLIYSFILGTVYGFTYIKYKNVVYPMILHSMSNIFMVGGGYLYLILSS